MDEDCTLVGSCRVFSFLRNVTPFFSMIGNSFVKALFGRFNFLLNPTK
jgi:hypothetical protein